MPRHINFGYNRDVPPGCIVDYFSRLLLRVKSAVRLAVIFWSVVPYHRFSPHRTFGHKLRTALYLYAPALVVVQMPVETVYIMQGKNIDKTLHIVHPEEIAAHIEHRPSVWKARSVHNLPIGEGDIAFADLGNGFPQGHNAIEHAGVRSSVDFYAVFINRHHIFLRVVARERVIQHYGVFCRSRSLFKLVSGHLLYISFKEIHIIGRHPA